MRPLLLAIALFAAGCATSAPSGLAADHPAHPDAPVGAGSLALSALGSAPAPVLPAALREPGAEAHAGHAGHAGHGASHDAHTSASHGASAPAGPLAPSDPVLGEALDAYLALQESLAADDLDGALMHAPHAARALGAWLDGTPGGEESDVDAARAALPGLIAAADLATVRVAFGHVSAPLARLVEAAAPGLAVERARCGMARDVPEQGIWLQRPGALRNPYFGTAMLACGTRLGGAAGGHTGH